MTPSELLVIPTSEVLAILPGGVRMFPDHGMSCPGCPFSRFETLADVAVVYRVDPLSLAASLLEAAGATAAGATQ